ncbi:MAG TPA: metal-sulfur cluster assembly factor, partial [Phycisphaerae bacterium]|nr:metal-sulfur cluster assembly factor [Phycisphaerae bacterium]
MPDIKDAILDALRTVQDPEIFKDIVSLNMVKDVKVCGDQAVIEVELTTPACPLKDRIRRDVENAVMKVPGVSAVEVKLSAQVRRSTEPKNILPGVRNILAVGAGKGGVGKSTIAVNIAAG